MGSRFSFTVAICLCLASSAAGQVVRFETSVGDFDMVLNPTHNPLLQGQVDNMLQYVNENRYEASWINRAPTGFVLQMGGFYSNTVRPSPTIDSVRNIFTFPPVEGRPRIDGLSNTIGTVSLALPGDGQGGAFPDEGTSSFFVNLTDNSFLDDDFTVFAAIPDMTVVNQIMALSKLDRTAEPDFGADAGNLAYSDVPVTADGKLVFIKRAFVISDALAVARSVAGVQSAMALSKAAAEAASSTELSSEELATLGESTDSSALGLSVVNVPEPNSVLLMAMGLSGLALRRRRAAKM